MGFIGEDFNKDDASVTFVTGRHSAQKYLPSLKNNYLTTVTVAVYIYPNSRTAPGRSRRRKAAVFLRFGNKEKTHAEPQRRKKNPGALRAPKPV
jgi:hypothetical protein